MKGMKVDHERFLFYKDIPTTDLKSPRSSRSSSQKLKAPVTTRSGSVLSSKENVPVSLTRPSPRNKTPTKSPKSVNSSPRKTPTKPLSTRNLFDTTADSYMEIDSPLKTSPSKRPRSPRKTPSKMKDSPNSQSSGSQPSTPSRRRPLRAAAVGINYAENEPMEHRSRTTSPKKLRAPSRTGTPKKTTYRTTNGFSDTDEEVPLEDDSDEEQHTPPKKTRTHRTPSKTPTKLSQSPGKSPLKSPRRKMYATLQDNMQKLNLDQSLNVSTSSNACLEDAKKLLWSDSVPIEMKQREKELKQIRAFCEQGIRPNSVSSAMYLGGAPGTGKTSCVLHVIHNMQKKNKKFTFVHLNGGEMIRPEEAFIHFYNALGLNKSGQKISHKTARQKLATILSMEDKERLPIIALVDELDFLANAKQSVVYDIFNWCSLNESRMNVIAISNTFDLPQRLDKRVQSRLGTNMIQFHPYDHREINDILTSRLTAFGDQFHKDTLKLCSMKVANMSGDIRKAFDIISQAIDLAVEKGHDQVQVEDLNDAMNSSRETYRVQLVKAFSMDEARLFKAVVKSLKDIGLDEVDFARIYGHYYRGCVEDGIKPLVSFELMMLLKDLALLHFVSIKPYVAQMSAMVSLCFSDYEAQFCLAQLEEEEKNRKEE